MAASNMAASNIAVSMSTLDDNLEHPNINKDITILKEDIRKLSDELKSKNEMLNSLLDLAHQQSMHIASLKAALQDTVPWDPDTSPHRPSSSSTPRQALWSEVVCRRKKAPHCEDLTLSNRFEALSTLTSDKVLAAPPSTCSPVATGTRGLAPCSTQPAAVSMCAQRPAKRSPSSSAKRRRLLRDAVRGHTRSLRRSDRERGRMGARTSSVPAVAAASPSAAVVAAAGTSTPVSAAGTSTSVSASAAGPTALEHGLDALVVGTSMVRIFNSLQNFPPIGAGSSSPAGPVRPADRGSRWSGGRGPVVQPAPPNPSLSGKITSRRRQPQPQGPSQPHRPSRQPAEQHAPSVLVVGSSMVRHVAVHGGRTFCHPGARVKDITSAALMLSAQHRSASTLILEAGINDIKNQQSEVLKQDFISLVDRLLVTGKRVIISGPLPPPRYGDVTTSRLRQLHLWLKGYCLTKSIPFVDNFAAFLNRRYLFKRDGLHPNQEGSRLLSVNYDLTVRSCTTATP